MSIGRICVREVLMLLAEEFASIGGLLNRESPPSVLAPQGG